MATEEVSKPPSLPPYPQMIMEAIEALKQEEGSNKSSISNYMESKYGPLPAGHANLFSAHLNRLRDTGELVFLKNNYLKPDPNAPPRRGRGRPTKPKSLLPSETSPGPPRPRGRPRKDPNAPPAPKKLKVPHDQSGGSGDPVPSKTGRPRGRPRKVQPRVATDNVDVN